MLIIIIDLSESWRDPKLWNIGDLDEYQLIYINLLDQMSKEEVLKEWEKLSPEFRERVCVQFRLSEGTEIATKVFASIELEYEDLLKICIRIWRDGFPCCWQCGKYRKNILQADLSWENRFCEHCKLFREQEKAARNGDFNCLSCACITDENGNCNCTFET